MRTGKNWNILKRGLKWTIGIMAAAVICICVNVGMKGYDMYRDAISQISLKDKVEQIRSKENYTEFAELPETYVDAVLSVEDHRFYGHIGIDPIAITRAVINDIRQALLWKAEAPLPSSWQRTCILHRKRRWSARRQRYLWLLLWKRNTVKMRFLSFM